MKITGVRAGVVRAALDGGLWNPQTVWRDKEAVLVAVETDAGRVGVGEAWCFGHGAAPVVALVEDLGRRIVGQDPLMSRAIWHGLHASDVTAAKGGALYHALSGIDIALWDLAGQALGQPLYRLLGGCRERVPVYASGGLYGRGKTPERLADELRGYVAAGFDAVKIKVGGAPLAEDVARVRAAREAIGPAAALMVDGVWSFSKRDAARFADRVAAFDVAYFEAPVVATDVAGCAFVKQHGAVAVCGQDHGAGVDYYRRLLTADAVDVVLMAPIACGGVTEALQIAALARAFYAPVTLHSSSTVVSFLAALHLAAALPHALSAEFHQVHRMLFDAAPAEALRVQGGAVRVPDAPGLGLDGRRLAALLAR